MNVLHINTMIGGGTGRTAVVLSRLLCEQGHSSAVCCADGLTINGETEEIPASWNRNCTAKRALRSGLARTLWKGTAQGESFIPDWQLGCASAEEILGALPFKPDIIVAYWTAYFVNTKQLEDLQKATGAPVVWYLMDMAPFTGGCHYAFECDRYKSKCGYCPAIGSSREQDVSHKVLQQRVSHISNMNVTYITASDHTAEQCRQSAIAKTKKVATIPICVDPEIFCPSDKSKHRKNLGLPLDKIIFFFGAQSLTGHRKGMKELYKSFEILEANMKSNGLDKDDVFLAYAGGAIPDSVTLAFNGKHLGYLKGDVALASAYQASDIFVCPSLEDSGPLMVNESIMCGTPVVSFEMGVAKDLVVPGETGFLAKLGDSESLAEALSNYVFSDPEKRKNMSKASRELGILKLTPEAQVQAFQNLFDQLLKN